MRFRESAIVTRVPGYSEVQEKKGEEWVCPDCDYFEEAAEE